MMELSRLVYFFWGHDIWPEKIRKLKNIILKVSFWTEEYDL